MLFTDTWIVEYSVSKQDFLVHQMSTTLDDNLNACMRGILRDYQLIGTFLTKETAQIFIEGFKSRISSIATLQARNPIKFNKAPQSSLNYSKALALIKKEIARKPRGFIKKMCDKSKLTYHTVIGLLNDTLPFKAPEMVMDVLVALGYHVIMTIVVESLGKGTKNYKKETTYLVRKATLTTSTI